MADMVTKQELEAAKIDVKHAGEAVNEEKVVKTRLGRSFKSIPLIVKEGEAKITQAAQTITSATASIISQKNQASEVISRAESDVVTAATDVHQRGNQEIINLQNAIDIAAAAGAGENGWTAQLIADASGKNQQQINDEYAQRFKTIVDPRNFGSPNNGVSDDAQGVREAVAYLDSIGGGELYMRSNVPWKFLTLSSNNQDAVVIKSRILVNFGDYSSTIQVGTEMRSVFKIVEDGGNYHAFCGWQGGVIQGANLAEYGLYSDPNSYTPYMTVKGIQLRGFTEAAASLNPYMSSFEMSHFSFSKRGLVLNNSGQTREITSTNISNCYANSCEEVGFKVANRMMYSSLQNCGVDQCNGIAYDLDMQGGSIIDCGAERVVQLARFPNINDGVTINGLVGVSVGSLNPNTPTPAAIEFTGSGVNEILISGVRLLTIPSETRYRDKKLSVHATSGKYPRVRILDNSIRQDETVSTIQSGAEPALDDPIKFTYTPFVKSTLETLLPSALKARLDEFNKTVNNYTHVIQLSDGSEDLEKIITGITGTGTLIIRGNASDRSLVKLRGARLGLTISNCTAKIIFQAVTFENNTGYGDLSLAQITVSNCREVIFDNVGFDSTKHTVGTAIRAQNDSKVFLRNGTSAGVGHAVNTVWQEQSGGTITIEPMPSPPTTGLWIVGQRIKNSAIGTGDVIEWVRVRNAANTAGEWRPITV